MKALDKGSKIKITRSNKLDYYLARNIADIWNQEPVLASHIRGEIPKSITAAEGDSYWRLAERYYSKGQYWIGIAQANGWRNLVPGSIVQLPPMQQLLFSPCYFRQGESLWIAGTRLKEPVAKIDVSNTNWLIRPKGRDSVYPLERLTIASRATCAD